MTCCRKLYVGGLRKRNLLKYRYIQFNQPASQVVLNPGDILVVNTNWWFHETKVLQENLKSSGLFEFKPRCFRENSVSQWLVNLIRSTSQAAGCGMIVIIHQNMDLQDKMEYSLFLSNVWAFPPIKSWAQSYLLIYLLTGPGVMHKIVRSIHLHSLGPSTVFHKTCMYVGVS